MSTSPWGTMNGWLRTEGEQRNAWLGQRVQDVRAARVAPRPEPARPAKVAQAAPRPRFPQEACADVA